MLCTAANFAAVQVVCAARDGGATLFRQVLKGGYRSALPLFEAFAGNETLATAEIPAARAEVWRLWRDACAEGTVPVLPAWTTLRADTAYVWTIPDSLERGVDWTFRYGTKGASPQGPRPLFLYLHGSGPSRQEWATGLRLAEQFDDAPCVYMIPRIPDERRYRWWHRSKQWAIEQMLREAMLCDSVDANRLYLFGISEGGYGAQRIASFYADYWAGAGPMAGGEPLRNAPVDNIGHIAFSLLTGAEDRMFFRNRLTRATAEALHCADSSGLSPDGRHRVALIPGRGHHIDYGETTPWLRRFVRTPRPEHFAWEDMEMDGRRRDGFYNLEILERPCDTLRQHYCVVMRRGRIDIAVSDVHYTTLERDPQFGIELTVARRLVPTSGGRLRLYLSEEQYRAGEKISVYVNGRCAFRGRLRPSRANMLRSCALFFDRERIFPYAVEVSP